MLQYLELWLADSMLRRCGLIGKDSDAGKDGGQEGKGDDRG